MSHKEQLQTIGENLAQTAKQYYKSHDLSIGIQIGLILIPLVLSLISMYLGGECNSDKYSTGIKILDYISFFFSILALVYYVYYGRNTELYKNWGERYLSLYKKVENYYRSGGPYDANIIQSFINEQDNLLLDNSKTSFHIFAKVWTDRVLEKEMKYGIEDVVWWRQK